MEFAPKKYLFEKDYPLSRKTVWRLLSDTEHLNHFIGLFPVQFSPAKKNSRNGFYREAFAKVGGIIPLKWKEYPFQWVEYENYTVERLYNGGPLKHFYGGIELTDSGSVQADGSQGTTVKLFSEFTPRNITGIAAIPITGVTSMKNTMKYLDDFLSSRNEGSRAYLPQKSFSHKVNTDELLRMEQILSEMPVEQNYIKLLHDYLIKNSDLDVAKMRPVPLAKLWKADSEQVLRLFLYATKAGILNLSWHLICPNCRVSKAEYQSLSQLETQFHCDLCGINYDANFENFVELYFSVHPSIRRAFDSSYCVGGPMITPHVKIQKVIEKGKSIQIRIPHDDDRLRLRVIQANHIVTIEQQTAFRSENAAIHYHQDGWSRSALSVDPENKELTIHNSSDSDIVVVLEQSDWSNDVITAAKVTTMQEFRDLFSSEVLSPGQQVGIENVTILFSDLQGSTSLYESVGDANAYGQVRRHFDVLTKSISKNSGSVVKTIGDAVMAVFYQPEDGLKAALAIQKHFSALNADSPDELVLKVGLYSGPAIAVNSNDRLDYFGRTVNIAARIQGQSSGNDIVLSMNDYKKEAIQAILKNEQVEIETFQAILKGIEGDVELLRVVISRVRQHGV